MKYRKPRFSQKRIESAQRFISAADEFIKDGINETQNLSEQRIASRNTEYAQNRKDLIIGREFIVDLLLWQKSQLNKSSSSSN